MKKRFDCVEMKRSVQERIYEETLGMTCDEELLYFRRAGERFWNRIEALRSKDKSQGRRTSPDKSSQQGER